MNIQGMYTIVLINALKFDDKIFDKDVFLNKENLEAWIATINMSLLSNELFVKNYYT